MSKLAKALTAAAGNAGESLYVEDVFSTYLYDGNSSTQTITNGIDLSGEGGLTWIKARDTRGHYLYDTERGATNSLSSDTNEAAQTISLGLTSFNSDGFSLSNSGSSNPSNVSLASWSFRKAEKFFDVVTYTGNSTAGRTVAHNLGSVPACIIVKRTDSASDWMVYHKGVNGGVTPEDFYLQLSQTSAQADAVNRWNDTAPTSTEFTLGDTTSVNASGGTYVAYLFASDAGGFGDDGSESIIKCGSFVSDGSGSTQVNCGFEPQWIIFKKTTAASQWYMFDTMRGLTAYDLGNDQYLWANDSIAEASANVGGVNATGFEARESYFDSGTWIYIAIRRPMKTPESGTEVFAVNDMNNSTAPYSISNFPVDLGIRRAQDFVDNNLWMSRLIQGQALVSNSTAAESPDSIAQFDFQDGFLDNTSASSLYTCWMFKRATGFFDVVAYTGTGSAQAVNHNLGVAPELIIEKRRDGVAAWLIYHDAIGNTKYLQFTTAAEGTSAAAWNNTSPTSTQFTVGTGASVSGGTHIAYLFATLAGVSKVGSYTGTGADLNVDCGFSAGARFILIKRTDSTGDWYVWDSFRGIVAGNDPYLLLNSTAAEVTSTDYIDPLASGFTVTSTAPAALNASGGTYIFLAIA